MVLSVGAVQESAATTPRNSECVPRIEKNRRTYCESVWVGTIPLSLDGSRAAATVSFVSESFVGLERRNTSLGDKFRRGKAEVQNYPDEFTLVLEPAVSDPAAIKQPGAEHLPKPAIKLAPNLRPRRVVMRWLDNTQRVVAERAIDLKEAEEAWTELRAPRVWYQGNVSGVNRPVTSSFEILVYGDDGKLLGALRGAALSSALPPQP